MTQQKLTELAQIYNTLLTISTKGQDTMIMGQCLSALQQFIMRESAELNKMAESNEEIA